MQENIKLQDCDYEIAKDNILPFRKPQVLQISPQESKRHGGATRGGASALRNEEDILNIMKYFLNRKNSNGRKSFGIRNYALVCFGFNSALRAGDILALKLSDVVHPITFEIVDDFIIAEEKTNKSRVVFINDVMKSALKMYLEKERPDYKNDLTQPLFCSREVDSKTGMLKALTIQRYNQLLKEVKQYLKLEGKISSHTCRKSWARGVYDSVPDDEKYHTLVLISAMLNHSNVQTTMIYLDIQKDELKNLTNKRQIGLKFE